MKKRKSSNQEKAKRYARMMMVALAVIFVVCIVLLLSGCGATDDAETNVKPNYKIVHSTSTGYEEGSYHLLKTEDEQEYLNFLENFDETQYEIVDISTSMDTGIYQSGDFYMVTYRNINTDSN